MTYTDSTTGWTYVEVAHITSRLGVTQHMRVYTRDGELIRSFVTWNPLGPGGGAAMPRAA